MARSSAAFCQARFLVSRVRCLLLACLGLWACGPGAGDYELEVDVSGLTPDVVQLSISAQFQGQTATSEVNENLDEFVLRLVGQSANPGNLNLSISGLDIGGCQRSAASVTATIPAAMPVAVTLRQDRGCRVLLNNLGDGGGTVSAALPNNISLSCTFQSQALTQPTCTYSPASAAPPADPTCTTDIPGAYAFCLPLGTQVAFTAAPDKNSYFAGWSGDCGGNSCAPEIPGGVLNIDPNLLSHWRCTSDHICFDNPQPGYIPTNAIFSRALDDAWMVGDGGALSHWNGITWTRQKSGTTANLRAVFAGAQNDIWVVGDNGLSMHSAGQGFTVVPTGVSVNLNGVAAGPSGVWAIGDNGTILEWSGSAWLSMPSGTTENLTCISQSKDGGLWLGGANGDVFTWNGQALALAGSLGNVTGIWAASTQEAFAIGPSSYLASGDGCSDSVVHFLQGNMTQQQVTLPNNPQLPLADKILLTTIWGSNSDDIWIASNDGQIFHWDGAMWKETYANPYPKFIGLSGSSPYDLWLVDTVGELQHWNGQFWSSLENSSTQSTLTSVTLLGENSAFITGVPIGTQGSQPTLLTQLTGAWQILSPIGGFPLGYTGFSGLWGDPVGQMVWFVDTSGSIVSYSLSLAVGPQFNYYSGYSNLSNIYGLSSTEIYVLSGSSLLQFNAATSTFNSVAQVPNGMNFYLLGGGQPSSGTLDLWLLGAGPILRYNGSSFSPVMIPGGGAPPLLSGVFWSSAQDVWISGTNGTLLHWDGTMLNNISLSDGLAGIENINGVWGAGPNDIWAVGSSGGIWHYTGTQPVPRLNSGYSGSLNGVSGTSTNGQDDVVFVGQGGVILHYRP